MREILKNFDWHIYGLHIGDIDYTTNMISGIVDDRMEQASSRAIKIHDEGGGGAEEAADDFLYYDWIETAYLWHYCFMRL